MSGVLCCGHVSLLCAVSLKQPLTSKVKIADLIAKGRNQKHDGHFAEAVLTLDDASRIAGQTGESLLEAQALVLRAGCQIYLFRYRQALRSANQALEISARIHENTIAGAAAGDLATVYAQLGDFAVAEMKAKESVAYLRASPRKDYLARALYSYGDIQAEQNEFAPANISYLESIALAKSARLEDAESRAELHLGQSLLDSGEYAGARKALRTACDLFTKSRDENGLADAHANLAELEYKQGHNGQALHYLDSAINSRQLNDVSPYLPTHLRGQILLALGRQWDALAEFRKAAGQASVWRRGALPGDATSIRTVAYLHDVYQDFAVLAASLAVQTYNTALAREAIEVLADNRAASLREQIAVALDRKGTLPPEYFDLLSQLQTAQSHATLNPSDKNQAKVEQIRLQIGEQENRFGINSEKFNDKSEKTSSRKSLRNIQRGLRNTELLLSFCLGKEKSFLWAITKEQVKLYELPAASKLTMDAEAFSNAIHRGQDPAIAGALFGGELFARVDRNLLQQPDWLIVSDGALLNSVPFSALPEPSSSGKNLLAVNHRLRFLPSEALLGGNLPSAAPRPEFIGIADPIYNLADSRISGNHLFLNARQSDSSIVLARLVGSDREIRVAAKKSGLPETQFLVGAKATSSQLRTSLSSKPEIVHFAVHVVSPEGKPEEAALALSMTTDDIPELLTPEAISSFRIPGSLVVLSGCSSQQGKALPSAGLIGLSRAWLLAGASAVVVSAWPTPDDSGHFFSSFYSHLETQTLASGSLVSRAAAALQLAQADMQNGGGYRSSPAFWAAYSIISKE